MHFRRHAAAGGELETSEMTPQIRELLIDTSRDYLSTKPNVPNIEAKLLELLPDSEIEAALVTEEQAKAYKGFVQQRARELGVPADQILKMSQPVLVRARD